MKSTFKNERYISEEARNFRNSYFQKPLDAFCVVYMVAGEKQKKKILRQILYLGRKEV